MNIKDRTLKELETRIHSLEAFIHKKGVGSGYLARAEKIQRNVNIALLLGITATAVGLTAWFMMHSDKEEK